MKPAVNYLFNLSEVHRSQLIVPVALNGGFGFAVFNSDDGNFSDTLNCLESAKSAVECGKLWLNYQLDVEVAA